MLSVLGISSNGNDVTILTTICHFQDPFRPLTANPTFVPTGGSGTILFTCGEEAAFMVANPGLATPTFTLPTGYVMLTIVAHVSGATTCAGGSGLVSGLTVSFPVRTSFDYCATISNAPVSGLATFTLAWTR